MIEKMRENLLSFIRRNWQTILIVATVILFWWPIFYNNGFFSDDLSFLREYSGNGLRAGFVFQTYNEHYIPVFKIFFFIMFKLFGQNFAPYMAVLLLIHILNVLLFYSISKLVFKGRKLVPLLLAIAFGVSSVYFELMRWFTTTQISLSFMLF